MALGERFRGGGTRGIAQFLGDHQHCDAGFDVRREDEPGSGKLKITCLGCGQTVTYKAGEAGGMSTSTLGLPTENGFAAPPQPPLVQAPPPVEAPRPLGPPAGPRMRPGPPPPRAPHRQPPRRRGLPGWIPIMLIGLLIAGGIGMIVIGLLRDSEQDSGGGPTTSQPTPSQSDSPQAEKPAEETAPPATAEPVDLKKRTFAGRFQMGVPQGWDSRVTDNAVEIKAPGGTAAIRVFFDRGERPPGDLGSVATGFLATEHVGATVSPPEPTELGGEKGVKVNATYDGGGESAIALSANGFSYLVAERVDGGASPQVKAEADAALASFKPL